MNPRDDFEDYWKDLRPNSRPIKVAEVAKAFGGQEKLVVSICEQTVRRLTTEINARYDHAPMTGELLANVVVMGIRVFMQEWREMLGNENLAGLLRTALDASPLSAEELTGIVQGLPLSVLERIAASSWDTATGTHALVSLEILRRSHGLAYTISVVTAFADGPRVRVSTSRGARTIEFFLDEEFRLPTEPPAV